MKPKRLAQMFSLEATDALDALIHGCQEKKVRFLQFVPNAKLLIGKRQGGKGRVVPRNNKKMCSA